MGTHVKPSQKSLMRIGHLHGHDLELLGVQTQGSPCILQFLGDTGDLVFDWFLCTQHRQISPDDALHAANLGRLQEGLGRARRPA